MSNSNTSRRSRGFDLDAIKWVRDSVRGISRDERLLLQYLATRCDPTHRCYPKQSAIAADLECSRSHVNALLKSLDDKGLISRKRRPNKSTRYTLLVSGCPHVTTSGCRSGDDTRLSKGNDIKEPLEVTTSEGTNIDIPVEESGETSDDVTLRGKTDKPEGISSEEENAPPTQKQSAALEIAAKYFKVHPSQKVMVGFWWALMRHYFPEYPTKRLSRHQFKALKSVFDTFGDSAYYVIAAAVSEWPDAARHAAEVEGLKPTLSGWPKYGDIPKLGPTPTFVCKAATGFAHYTHDCNQLQMETAG